MVMSVSVPVDTLTNARKLSGLKQHSFSISGGRKSSVSLAQPKSSFLEGWALPEALRANLALGLVQLLVATCALWLVGPSSVPAVSRYITCSSDPDAPASLF